MIKGEELGIYTGVPVSLCLRAAPGSGQSSALPAQLAVGWMYVGHVASATPTVSNGQPLWPPGSQTPRWLSLPPGLRALYSISLTEPGMALPGEVTTSDL